MSKSYTVNTEVFQGPLEVLLTLIEKRKLFINDIALSEVTDAYINYVKSIGKFPMSQSAHFVLIASTLLLIKSKSLLPTLEFTEEETESMEDLERRLKIYKRMRELSLHIKNRFGKRILFSKTPPKNIEPVFSPDDSMSTTSLLENIRIVLKDLPKKKFVPVAVIEKIISLEEMVDRLTERITKNLKMSFREFSGIGKEEKITVIISFLAVLELTKQGIIAVTQDNDFGEINLESQNVGVPRYS